MRAPAAAGSLHTMHMHEHTAAALGEEPAGGGPADAAAAGGTPDGDVAGPVAAEAPAAGAAEVAGRMPSPCNESKWKQPMVVHLLFFSHWCGL